MKNLWGRVSDDLFTDHGKASLLKIDDVNAGRKNRLKLETDNTVSFDGCQGKIESGDLCGGVPEDFLFGIIRERSASKFRSIYDISCGDGSGLGTNDETNPIEIWYGKSMQGTRNKDSIHEMLPGNLPLEI